MLGELVDLDLAKLPYVTDSLALEPRAEVGGVLLALAVATSLEVDDAGEGLRAKKEKKRGRSSVIAERNRTRQVPDFEVLESAKTQIRRPASPRSC